MNNEKINLYFCTKYYVYDSSNRKKIRQKENQSID